MVEFGGHGKVGGPPKTEGLPLRASPLPGRRPAWTRCAIFSFMCPILQGRQRNSVLFKWCLSSKNCIPNRYTLYRGVTSPTTKMSQLSRASWNCSKGMAAVGRSVHSDHGAGRQGRVTARLPLRGTGRGWTLSLWGQHGHFCAILCPLSGFFLPHLSHWKLSGPLLSHLRNGASMKLGVLLLLFFNTLAVSIDTSKHHTILSWITCQVMTQWLQLLCQ